MLFNRAKIKVYNLIRTSWVNVYAFSKELNSFRHQARKYIIG